MSESSDIPPDRDEPSTSSLSNQEQTVSVRIPVTLCNTCKRTFKTERGLKQHVRVGKCQLSAFDNPNRTDSISVIDSTICAETVTFTAVWGQLSLEDVTGFSL